MSAGRVVALDGRRLQDDPPGGVGRTIARTLPALAELDDLVVLMDASRGPAAVPPGVRIEALPRPRGLPEAAWLHGPAASWLRRHDCTVHGTFNAIPWRVHRPACVTIWDLTFELHPEDFDTPRRRLMRHWFARNARYAARHAGIVITCSTFSADAIAEHYGTPAERLRVIPCGADPVFRPEAAARAPEVAARLGIRRPYLVSVGGAPRRGAATAVAAWRRLRSVGGDADLVVLGSVDAPPEPGLHVVRGLPDDEWAALLAGAELLCYPTRYEGFGMPALEALASGTPVVAARTSSVPEVLGDAAAWAYDTGVDAVAEALIALVGDDGRRAALRTAGLQRAAAWPSWAEIARLHHEAYEAVGS